MPQVARRTTAARSGPVPAGIAALALTLLLALAAAGPAAAQGFDLGRILGSPAEPEAAGSERPRAPLQSLPAPAFDPATAPTAADYGRIGANAADRGAEPMLGDAGQAVTVFKARLGRLLARMPDAVDEISTTLAASSPTGHGSYFLGAAIFAGLLLVIGQAVTELFNSYVARPLFVGMQRPDPVGYAEKLPVLAYRIVLRVIGVAITLAVAAGSGLYFYDEHAATLVTAIAIFASYAAIAVIETVWRMILAPFLRAYRLPRVSDRQARRLYRWLSAVSAFAVATIGFCYWVEALGLPREVHVIVTVLLSLATVIAILAVIRSNHGGITAIILGGRDRREVSWGALAFATLWAPVASLYLLGAWADLSFRLIMGIPASPTWVLAPYAVLMAGLAIYALTIFAIERIFRRRRRIEALNRQAAAEHAAEAEAAEAERLSEMQETHFGDSDAEDADDGDDEGSAIPVPRQTPPPAPAPGGYRGMRTMEDLARRAASLFALAVAAYALLRFWGGSDIFERYVVLDILSDVVDVALIGYIAFHAVRIWIDRRIEEEVGDEPDEAIMEGEGGGAGQSRLATLLPLVRNAILIVISTAVLLIVAAELGVNVAPLFAGAGIVGLAIGFGSQALVRDILSGAFFLMDDAFRKGEYIDVGNVKGTVEKISLRSFQLRHHLGMLHTIPFGEIQFLTNFSRDWVMMKLPLRLTYDTDVERVRKLIKKLGQSLLDDPEIGEKFLAPLKSQGVIQMEDSAMIVRVKFMTRPGDQWVVRKRVYHEIRELFAREGISFAHREVTVRIPGLPRDRELDEDERQAAGAAARTALDVVEPGKLARTGTGGAPDDR